MTTNKDFREFQEFLKDQKNIEEGAISSALKSGAKMAAATSALSGLYGAGQAAYGGGSKEDIKKAGIEGAKSVVTEPIRKTKEGDYWGAVADVASTVSAPAALMSLGGDLAQTDIGRKVGKAIGDYVPGAKTVASYAKKFRDALGIKSTFEPEAPKQEPVKKAPEEPVMVKAPETPIEPKKVQSINIPTPITPKVVKTTIEKESGGKKMDKKKSISEALAEVQRNSELMKTENAKGVWNEGFKIPRYKVTPEGKYVKTPQIKPDTSVGQVKLTPPEPPPDLTKMGKSGQALGDVTTRGGGAGTTPPEPPKGTTPSDAGGGKKGSVGKTLGGIGGAITGAALGTIAGSQLAQYLKGDGKTETDAVGGTTPTTTPATTTGETPKTKAPEKMTFGQAFAKARQAAAEKGAKTTGQFEWEGKKYQTNIMGTGTAKKPQEKYVPMAKQTKVDIGTSKVSTTLPGQRPQKEPEGPPIPKAEQPKTQAAPITPTPNMFNPTPSGPTDTFKKRDTVGPSTSSFSTESGKKRKMSEEYDNEINEAPIIPMKDLEQYRQNVGNRNATLGQYLNDLRNKSARVGGKNDPSVIQKSLDKKFPIRSNMPDVRPKAFNPAEKPDGRVSTNSNWADAGAAERARVNAKNTADNITRPSVPTSQDRLATGAAENAKQRPVISPISGPRSSTSTADTLTPAGIEQRARELGALGHGSSYESGGKKKVKESTGNPFIDSFLALQETKAGNVFEAAKKLKKNDGNLANNYPPYDKVTRGDVIAGRLGKDEMGGKRKVHEASRYDGKNPFDPKDSSVQGSGDVTSDKPKTKTTPKSDYSPVTKDDKPYISPESKKSGMGVKEEYDIENITFSDEELAYFEAVMEAKAPEPPEENMSDSVSSKMDRKTLTDSKKVK